MGLLLGHGGAGCVVRRVLRVVASSQILPISYGATALCPHACVLHHDVERCFCWLRTTKAGDSTPRCVRPTDEYGTQAYLVASRPHWALQEQRCRQVRTTKTTLLQSRCKLLKCLRYKAQTSAKARKGYQKHCEQRKACQPKTPRVPYIDVNIACTPCY